MDKKFSDLNVARCQAKDGFSHRLDSWSRSDWFTAVLGELGEAANVAKKLNRVRDGVPGNKENRRELKDKLRREIGDAAVYLDLLARSEGFYLFDAMVEAFNGKSSELGMPYKYSD